MCSNSRVLGSLDVPLSPAGVEQVLGTVSLLNELVIEELAIGAICSSDTGPAHETAQLLAEKFGLPLISTSQLTNQSLGLWEGLLKSDIERKYGRRFCSRGSILDIDSPPEGEDSDAVRERVAAALRKATRRYRGLLVVAGDPLTRYIKEYLQPAETLVIEPASATDSPKAEPIAGCSGERNHCHSELLSLPISLPAPKMNRGWSMFGNWMGSSASSQVPVTASLVEVAGS